MNSPRTRYHHGDLRSALLNQATHLIREGGVEALSMRVLAQRTGVSRTALYHHFQDKNDLLCAIAEMGFQQLDELINAAVINEKEVEGGLRAFIRSYVHFAADNPEQYDLMFGRAIWKIGTPTETLKQIAFHSFKHYVEKTALLNSPVNSLRTAQVSWATLHGICKFIIDGIYVNREDLNEICEQALKILLASNPK